jgi:hypothetical protein
MSGTMLPSRAALALRASASVSGTLLIWGAPLVERAAPFLAAAATHELASSAAAAHASSAAAAAE